MGNVDSFSLAIPGCKLYVHEVLSAIAQFTRSSKLVTKVQGGFRSDIQYWRFLVDWSDCLPWRSEQHCIVTLFCDGSKHSWGGVLLKDGKRMESRDYWLDSSETSTLLKLGLCCTLSSPSEITSATLGLTFIPIVELSRLPWRILPARVPL